MEAERQISQGPEQGISSADMDLLMEKDVGLLLRPQSLGKVNAGPENSIDKGRALTGQPVNMFPLFCRLPYPFP